MEEFMLDHGHQPASPYIKKHVEAKAVLQTQRSSSSASLKISPPATELAWARRLRKWPLGTCQACRSWWAELMVLERPRLVATAASKVSVSCCPAESGLHRSSCSCRTRSPHTLRQTTNRLQAPDSPQESL
ncbi:hypothetical protein JZ751_014384 [Albula glossodonta]|uniref:Uncharacterized protein n=1 Tax=Albula glossodonta TaxID=121402 RepID=A0A8T2NR79_9TELE|nr:hypothetical protein JZ751_014384 [Albula glossodonta]